MASTTNKRQRTTATVDDNTVQLSAEETRCSIADITLNHQQLQNAVGKLIMSSDGKSPKDAVIRFLTHPELAKAMPSAQGDWTASEYHKFKQQFVVQTQQQQQQQPSSSTTTQPHEQEKDKPQIDILQAPDNKQLTYTPVYSKLSGMLRFKSAVVLFVNLDLTTYNNMFACDLSTTSPPLSSTGTTTTTTAANTASTDININSDINMDPTTTQQQTQFARFGLSFYSSASHSLTTHVVKSIFEIAQTHGWTGPDTTTTTPSLTKNQIYLFCRLESKKQSKTAPNNPLHNNYVFWGNLALMHTDKDQGLIRFLFNVCMFTKLLTQSGGFYGQLRSLDVANATGLLERCDPAMNLLLNPNAYDNDEDEDDEEGGFQEISTTTQNVNKKRRQGRDATLDD